MGNNFYKDLLNKTIKNKHIYGAVFCVENEDGTYKINESIGNIDSKDRYLIASVTKMYITTLIMILKNENKISFEDKITKFFPNELISELHVLKGVDYTGEITVKHLLINTSGLPDYFYYTDTKGSSVKNLVEGNDIEITLEKVIENTKKLKPKFKPGQKNKVFYSDTNFQLLGSIIEKVTNKPISDVFEEYIFKPLDLKHTSTYKENIDNNYVKTYYGKDQLDPPKYLSTITAEGGIVSTSEDVMLFNKAFYNGFFFPKEQLKELMRDWNLIYFPGQFYFGNGLEKLWVPRIFTPFHSIGDIYGFWGQTGSFAFYNPKTKLYFTGTINQLNGFGHGSAFKMVLETIKKRI